MLFSSIPFLYYFLPVTLIVYFIVPKGMKNGILLLASLFFYAWGEPRYIMLMIASILAGYGSGILLEHWREKRYRKYVLTASILFDVGMLAYFKYVDFFVENMNRITGMAIPMLQIALPIGISFYTFQILSYKVDVYRGEVAAQKNIVRLAAYISMFPQLVAGPIVRYQSIEKQLENRSYSLSMISGGIRRFVLGLSKKILIANTLGELCAVFKVSDDKSVLFFWVYAIAYMLQIYFDFSGYSDMAIGLGRILGFEFPENFNYPYVSKSITEFWRRWHITLGSWFRDYVYIPLGGNRVSKISWIRNVCIVWMMTGFWHGAEWNFIVWGLLFAILLVVEKQWLGSYLKRGKWFSHVYVLFFVMISFVIFNAVDMKEAGDYIGGLFGVGNYPLSSAESWYYLQSNAMILGVAVLGATPIPQKLVEQIKGNLLGERIVNIAEPVILIMLILVVTAYLVDGSFNPFLYFRF